MKKITSIILFMCLSCQLVLKLAIVAWFEINQDYIAATLCENKDKPELVCCGKCVLTKQLQKADSGDKKEKGEAPTKTDKTTNVAFILPESTSQIYFLFGQPKIQNPTLRSLFADGVPVKIFHPPNSLYS